MRLPWKQKARQVNSQPVSTEALELETAKEKDELWPVEFCLGE